MNSFKVTSTITCPRCGGISEETPPDNACIYFWQCDHCNEIIKPEKGDCCVFCSFGTIPCPPVRKTQDGYDE